MNKGCMQVATILGAATIGQATFAQGASANVSGSVCEALAGPRVFEVTEVLYKPDGSFGDERSIGTCDMRQYAEPVCYIEGIPSWGGGSIRVRQWQDALKYDVDLQYDRWGDKGHIWLTRHDSENTQIAAAPFHNKGRVETWQTQGLEPAQLLEGIIYDVIIEDKQGQPSPQVHFKFTPVSAEWASWGKEIPEDAGTAETKSDEKNKPWWKFW